VRAGEARFAATREQRRRDQHQDEGRQEDADRRDEGSLEARNQVGDRKHAIVTGCVW
jgi:hypothetical protein